MIMKFIRGEQVITHTHRREMHGCRTWDMAQTSKFEENEISLDQDSLLQQYQFSATRSSTAFEMHVV